VTAVLEVGIGRQGLHRPRVLPRRHDKPYPRPPAAAVGDDSIEVNLRPEFRVYARPDESKNTFGFRVLLKRKADDAK